MLPLDKQLEMYRYEVRMQMKRDECFRKLRKMFRNARDIELRLLEDYENNRLINQLRNK